MYSQRYAHRQEKLIERIRDHKLDALALVPGPNVYYFTGLSFHLSERPIAAIFREDGRRA
ncbi:MAG: aminopeptidase P family N-terminal domain-containing protein, partial [Anaerolineae bacterium]